MENHRKQIPEIAMECWSQSIPFTRGIAGKDRVQRGHVDVDVREKNNAGIDRINADTRSITRSERGQNAI